MKKYRVDIIISGVRMGHIFVNADSQEYVKLQIKEKMTLPGEWFEWEWAIYKKDKIEAFLTTDMFE